MYPYQFIVYRKQSVQALKMEPESNNPFVFFDIFYGESKGGRIVIELFKDIAPRTVENFRALCTGEKSTKEKTLHYKGTHFHKVVNQCFVQGGYFTTTDNFGGESIYGKYFEDENFTLKHDVEGLVGMSSNGCNTNNSQFYITMVPCPQLDDNNVVFGQVRKGFNLVLEMAEIPRQNDIPLEKITIVNCGELKKNEPWLINENDGTEDCFPPWPQDWDLNENAQNENDTIESAITKIKDSGNYFFKKHNYIDSQRKYMKTLRYIDWYTLNKPNHDGMFVKEEKVKALLNLIAVKLKKHQFKEALNLCNQAIELNPNEGKCYYRRTQAKLGLQEIDEALSDVNKASKMLPNDRSVKSLSILVKEIKLNYLQRERLFYGKLFNA